VTGLSLYHLSILVVELVVGGIVLWLLIRHAGVIKFNINLESDGVPFVVSFHGENHGSANNMKGFELIWRGAKKLPRNWQFTLYDAAVRAGQLPLTVEIAGGKLTFVVYASDQIVPRCVGGTINVALLNPKGSADLGRGPKDV